MRYNNLKGMGTIEFNMLTEEYKQLAQKNQIVTRSKNAPIKKKKTRPMKRIQKRVVRSDDFNRLYKQTIGNNIKKRVSNFYNYSQMFYDSLVNWLHTTANFDTFVTYRPLKTKITGFNAGRLFDNVVYKIKNITELFWVVEGDWNGESNHCHILINSGGIDKQTLADAMSRGSKELLYYEPIKNKKDAIGYCSKYLKGKHIREFDYINRQQLIDDISDKVILENSYHSQTSFMHPNKEYHDKHKFMSEFFYGVRDSRIAGEKKEPEMIWNYSRSKGFTIKEAF